MWLHFNRCSLFVHGKIYCYWKFSINDLNFKLTDCWHSTVEFGMVESLWTENGHTKFRTKSKSKMNWKKLKQPALEPSIKCSLLIAHCLCSLVKFFSAVKFVSDFSMSGRIKLSPSSSSSSFKQFWYLIWNQFQVTQLFLDSSSNFVKVFATSDTR